MKNLTEKQQRWKSVWPARIIALIAVIQLILTLGIIGLEAGSLIIDVDQGTAYAGFYCSVFFIMTFISMFAVVCCNTYSMPCAIHTLVQNVLSIAAASVVIYFDSIFMNNPALCFFTSSSCSSSSNSALSSTSSTAYQTKTTCIKAQLAGASLMMLTNVIYIGIFIFIVVKSNRRSNDQMPFGQPPVSNSLPPHPYSGNPNIYPYALHPPAPNFPSYVAECPNCHIYMRVG